MKRWQQLDYLPADELSALQSQRLRDTTALVYRQIPFYRELFDRNRVSPEQVQGLDDLPKLPFTTKNDLRQGYPFGMAATAKEKLVRIHASSGTTGKPIVTGYTANDLLLWSEAVARLCRMAGVTSSDIAQISFGYGLFTGGFGLHYGLEKLGAMVIPFSSGNTERQLALMQDFRTTVLVSTPSFAIYMAELARDLGYDPAGFGLRLGLFGGEPCSEAMREDIERQWGLKATTNYGLTEIIGPGVSGECDCRQGLHILEDLFYPEVIDPQTGRQLEDGEKGELVLTSLAKEGFPVIRYRTGDITRLIAGPCPCGRTNRRMDYVTGRTDDMLIVKGVNIFPSQIEEVLATFSEVSPHYRLVLKRHKGYVKELEVQVELTREGFTDSFRKLEELEGKIRQRLRSALSLFPKVKLINPKTLERSTGKSRRIYESEE